MDQIELEITKREVLGKKVRFLRRQGITPVHLFGHGIESMALQCDTAKLQQVLTEAGEAKVISLKLDNEKRPRSVLVREVQVDSLKGGLLHVDFYQVKMTEEVKVEVPITLVGEAPALKLRANMLMQELDTLTVECLPAKIPASVELDISSLTEAEQMVRVKDIELEKGVTILNDPELVVVKVSSRPVEVVAEREVTEEAVEAPEAAPPPEKKAPKEE
ncbi:MAG: 50S ribosomal protein L25 [Dehalococcoidia bacterium]|nr:50S ribosomal protein L25 [Dehalococcoidia bacterium]MDH5781794.1 50S ribosomal protein L25 [Dehalococcoidia bacterium]